MNPKSRSGVALVLALVLGLVLLMGLGSLLGTMVSEYRSSMRYSLNSVAFHLAEAGIDRTANAITKKLISEAEGWTKNGTTYSRDFTVTAGTAGNESKGYRVVYSSSTSSGTTYHKVSSRGWVRNEGGKIYAQRAIEVSFKESTNGGTGVLPGAYTKDGFTNGSYSTGGAISATQPGAIYDSYDSTNNTAPNPISNRSNKCVVGTLSSEDNALNLSNGKYYAQLKTGKDANNPTPRVDYNTDSSGAILARLDNPDTTDQYGDLVTYDPAKNYIGRDFSATFTLDPPPASTDTTWTIITPATDATKGSQCLGQASLGVFKNGDLPNTPITAVNDTTLAIGSSDKSRIYIPTRGLGNYTTLEITGEVFIVTTGVINSLNVVFKSKNAKLTLYTDNNVPVITSQQKMSSDAAVNNYEAKYLTIGILPGNAGISSIGNSDYTADKVYTSITTSLKNPTPNDTMITMNNVGSKAIVARFLAPWSMVQIDADGNGGGMFCGTLMARILDVKGTNGFPFHCDQALGGGDGTTTAITVDSWRQILTTSAVFD